MSISIKEASEQLGCPAHTIRYYEKEGLLPYVKRDQHGKLDSESKMLEQLSHASSLPF